ncbi:MAG: HAD family phosphatase, partial [Burkholderiales bacterium]|nr:HAD family phosphatase [Anaerolineae bacterium]
MTDTFPQAIIFDMDGLLVDSEPVWLDAETKLLERRGIQYRHEVREQIVGKRMDEFMSILRETHEVEDALDILMAEVTQEMVDRIGQELIVQPGALELLEYVLKHNIPRAIASSSPLVIIDAVLASRGWQDIFPVRCSGDDVPHGKPAPDVYLKAARLLDIAPENCLALEDSPNGARAAVAAGMVCYAVPDPSHSSHMAFEKITPHVFGSLHDVLA